MRVGFTATLCAALIGCALCLASAPAAAQGQRENASEERPTPIDIWISRPREIKLTSEQRDRVEELKTQYVVEFGELGGADEMAVVMQARALQTKYRKLVRDLLTPEQQAVFDENVRLGADEPTAAQGQRENASEERPTPIDTWISRPRQIELTSEQRDRVEELKTQYVVEFSELGGADEMAVVMQARALQTKYRKLVRDLLTPEQQAVFDENVRAGG